MNEAVQKAARTISLTVLNVIAEGEKTTAVGGIPHGHLYAVLMSVGMTHEMYIAMISEFKETGAIKEENFLLKKGPNFDEIIANLKGEEK